jgi:hypothetical protein
LLVGAEFIGDYILQHIYSQNNVTFMGAITNTVRLPFYKLLLFLLLVPLTWNSHAQLPKKFENNYLLFIDHIEKQPVLIIDDTLLYKGYDFVKVPLEKPWIDFPINELIQVPLPNKNYLVDRGCGPIYEFKDNKLIQISNSLRLRNQYNANVFGYNNEIYFFGGYGLFTNKNIITYYDTKRKEWLQVPVTSIKEPASRSMSSSIKISDDLYIWGGHKKIKGEISKLGPIEDSIIWKFNLKSNQWTDLGVTKDIPLNIYNFSHDIQIDNVVYTLSPDGVYKYNVINNEFTAYKYEMPYLVNCVYDPYAKKVILLTRNSRMNNEIQVLSLDELTKTIAYEGVFYRPPYFNIIFWAMGVFLFVSLAFLCFKFIKPRSQIKESIIYHKDKQEFTYRNKPLDLDIGLYKLLVYLSENQDHYEQLENINMLFASNGNHENYVTVNKRRDKAIKDLVFKLSVLLNRDEKHIILKRKNALDKRIMEVKLAPNIVKTIK